VLYDNKDQEFDERVSAIAEDILANSLTFYKGLLEDPNIWESDFAEFDPLSEQEEQGAKENVEQFLNEVLFTSERITSIL